jgi:VanZ family protein
LKLYTPAIIWLFIILVISGYPGNHIPSLPVWQFDKLVHSIIYAILSFCLLIPYYRQYIKENRRLRIGLIIVFIGIFYGGFMELLQNYIFINRSGNWYDFIANMIGAIIGVILYPLFVNFLPINRWLKIK